MTKRKFAAIWCAFMILCGLLGLATLPADAAATAPTAISATTAADTVQSCRVQPDGKCYWYTSFRFRTNSICFQNNVGTFWNYQSAENGFESGDKTVLFFNHGAGSGSVSAPCSDTWAGDQILTFTTESAATGSCYRVSYAGDVGGIYTGRVTIHMNLSPESAACRGTTQIQNNSVSNAIGVALGLLYFTSSTNLTGAVMNQYFRFSYNFPGTDDRNALYWLY